MTDRDLMSDSPAETLYARLLKKIAEWREQAFAARRNAENARIETLDRRQCFGVSQALEGCADELETMLEAAEAVRADRPRSEPAEGKPGVFVATRSTSIFAREAGRADLPPVSVVPENMKLQDGDARRARDLVRAHRMHGGVKYQPIDVDVLERILWKAGLYGGPVTITEASPAPPGEREVTLPKALWFVERLHPSRDGYIQVQPFATEDEARAFAETWKDSPGLRVWDRPTNEPGGEAVRSTPPEAREK